MVTTSDERKFVTFRRGEIRDNTILRNFRNALRGLIDPETGAEFTEDRITEVTQRGSRFYLEADGVDLYGMSSQQRARWLANQLRPKWSNTNFLDDVHGELWFGPDARLSATGGSGTVTATAAAGSVFPGSTTIGDPAAAVAIDPNGLQFQVLVTATIPVGGTSVTLQMKAIDTGSHTNPTASTLFTWSINQPPSADPEFSVLSNFSGGFDIETDSEFADRIESQIRYRPASGNNAHFMSWARESSTAVETAYVYANAWNAGSVLVCVLQKRGTTEGPNARTDVAAGTLITARNYLVPPASPVVPERAHVVVVPPNEQPSDIVVRLSMGFGTDGGWADLDPWPRYTAAHSSGVLVASIISPTQFTVSTDQQLPGGAAVLTGANAPQLMIWDEDNSKFIELDVNSVTETVAGVTYTVDLNSAPSGYTTALNDIISPYTSQATIIQDAFGDYFDELGPGEVVDLTTDPRAVRAFRYPPTSQGAPNRAGEAIISRIIEALGGVVPDASLPYMSRNTPDLPGDVIDGPNIVTLGEAGVYPL
jgi:hypothetical protein